MAAIGPLFVAGLLASLATWLNWGSQPPTLVEDALGAGAVLCGSIGHGVRYGLLALAIGTVLPTLLFERQRPVV